VPHKQNLFVKPLKTVFVFSHTKGYLTNSAWPFSPYWLVLHAAHSTYSGPPPFWKMISWGLAHVLGHVGLLFDLHRRDQRAVSLVLHSRPCYCYKSSYDFMPEIFQFHRSVSELLMKDKCMDDHSIHEEKKMRCHHFLLFLLISYKDLSWSKWSTQFIFML